MSRTRLSALLALSAGLLLGVTSRGFAAGSDGTWAELPVSATGPFGRDGTSATFDSRRGQAMVVGGSFRYFFHGPILAYDPQTWALDMRGANGWLTVGPSSYTAPMNVERGAVAYDSLLDQAWAFGGAHYDAFTQLLDHMEGGLARLDLGSPTPAWTTMTVVAPSPAPRFGHTLVLDDVHRRLILFGGRGVDGHTVADVWTYDLTGPGGWTLLEPAGTPPSARDLHAAIVDRVRDRMVIVGGTDEASAPLSDAWALDLGDAPAWTPIAATGSYAGGPAPAVYDARDDRMLVLAGAGSGTVTAQELAFPSQPAWRALAPSGQLPPRANAHFAAVIDPQTHTASDLGSDSFVGMPVFPESYWRTHYLYLDPPPLVHLTATMSPGYKFGVTTLEWQVTLDRALYGPITVEREDPGGAVDIASGLPDALGRLTRTDSVPVAGRHYDYRLRWFDGTSNQRTPAIGIDTPPAPIDLGVSVDSVFLRADRLEVHWSVPDDSAQWLAPIGIEQSLAGGAWQPYAVTYPDLGHTAVVTTAVPPETHASYRLTWGPSLNDYASPDTGLTTLPVPMLSGSAGNGAGAVVEWRYPAGRPLATTAFIEYSNGWAPIGAVSADTTGLLHLEDSAVSPGNVATYRLGWDVGGETRYTSAVAVIIRPDSLNLLSALAADSAAVVLAWSYPDLETQRTLTLERRQSGAWTILATLAPAPPAQRRYTDATAQPHTRYQYRVLWATDGVSLHSNVLDVDVAGGPSPPLALALGRAMPNPAMGTFGFALSLPDEQPATLSLMTITGRVVRQTTVTGAGTRNMSYDTTGLAAGVYVLKLSHPGATRTERVVVVH